MHGRTQKEGGQSARVVVRVATAVTLVTVQPIAKSCRGGNEGRPLFVDHLRVGVEQEQVVRPHAHSQGDQRVRRYHPARRT